MHTRQKTSRGPVEPDRSREVGDATGVGRGPGSATRTPRWGSVLAIVIAVGLILLLIVLHLTGVLGPGAH